MNLLSRRQSKEWNALVTRAFKALQDVTAPTETVRAFTYRPKPISGGKYQITPPVVTVAPGVGRLVVKFTVRNFEGALKKYDLEAVAVFDEELELVPDETRKVLRNNPATSPFFAASLVPRAYGGAAPAVVNTLAVAALGVGLLAAAIANRRLSAARDTDVSLRLLPHYANLLINQVRMAMQVAALGGGDDDVRKVAQLVDDKALRKAFDDWDVADGWEEKGGFAFEKDFQGETVRLWKPTVATLVGSYVMVLKFDRVTGKGTLDDHVAMTVVVRGDGTIGSVVGDAYYPSAGTIFTVEKNPGHGGDPLGAWIDDFRKRSVEAGLPAVEFATGVGKLLQGLAVRLRKVPVPR